MVVGKLFSQAFDLIGQRESFGCQGPLQVTEPVVFGAHPAMEEGTFFHLVLLDYVGMESSKDFIDEYLIFFEELRQIDVLTAFITLLVEINGSDPELDVVEVLGDVEYEVVAAHIAQQAHETTFVELHEFFRDPSGVEFWALQMALSEHIAGDPGNMFFDECLPVCQVVYAVGG